MSESNMESFQVRWPGESPTQDEFMKMLPTRRSLKDWENIFINNEWSSTWNTLESDMREISTQHPNTIFTVEIGNEDGEHWVQYHQAGRYYEEPEVRQIPDFNPSKLRETQHPDPLDINTPIAQVPTLQDVLQEVLLKIEQHVWDRETDQLFDHEWLTIADPYKSHGKPFTSLEAALERVPRLRGILAAAHQECNQFRETTECIKDIFSEHLTQVLNHWTFTERRELEALALEVLTVKNAKPTTEKSENGGQGNHH